MDDLISRQAAIDAMCDACADWCDEGVCKKVSAIQQLPPAQPEHKIHFADADHVWIDGKQYISLRRFQEAVVEAQPERKTGRWILKDLKWECDQCGCRIRRAKPFSGNVWNYYYCPNCGAKMEAEHD